MDSTNNSSQRSWFSAVFSAVYEATDRTLSWALGMVRQHLIFFHIITAVTIFLSAEYILSRGFHIELGPQHGVGIEVLIVIISAAIPFFITASLLWREIWRLVNLTQIAS